METLSNLESFVRSAESGSFSAAARLLALTPAAISRNVAQLERNLGVRLFQRSTRGLKLTEEGERFLTSVSGGLDMIQGAIADVTANMGVPHGVLKLGAAPRFGRSHVLPLMNDFLALYPSVLPDWNFDNRHVDLIADGFDASIGGGFELSPGVVARKLAPAHVVAVASPTFMRGKHAPRSPADLAELAGVVMRSPETRRIRVWTMRNPSGLEMLAQQAPHIVLNDPDAICSAVVAGMGVGLVALADVLAEIERGELMRILPDWYVDAGQISLYFPSQKLLPSKTRAFVDFVTAAFEGQNLSKRFSAIN